MYLVEREAVVVVLVRAVITSVLTNPSLLVMAIVIMGLAFANIVQDAADAKKRLPEIVRLSVKCIRVVL